jgi:hypothetical protein
MLHRVVTGVSCALAALILVAGVSTPRTLLAQSASADWELTGFTGPVSRVTSVAGGILHADRRDANGLWRSDDAGDSWREISVPSLTTEVLVDPIDPSIMYAIGWKTSKTTDGGATWTKLVTNGLREVRDLEQPWQAQLSPADPRLLYLHPNGRPASSLIRSHDGGLTWEEAAKERGSSADCTLYIPVFRPHPVDPARILRVAGCWLLSDEVGEVYVSDDQGSTWTYRGKLGIDGLFTGIDMLVGWEGTMPSRLYATTRHTELYKEGMPIRGLGRSLFRSDDEGRTWSLLLTSVQPGLTETVPSITGLAYDPARPDVVYLSSATGVRLSTDAGQTWSTLGRQDLPTITSIVRGKDGRTLYAATEAGLFRLRLGN